MQRFVKTSRIIILSAIVCILCAVYVSALYRLQLYDDGSDPENISSLNTSTYYKTVTAARGDLLDRNGVPLITSRVSYNVTLSRDQILNADDPNAVLFELCETAKEFGIKYDDTFPLTDKAPFAYVTMTDEQKDNMASYFEFFDLEDDISATDLMIWMKDHYDIPYTTSLNDAREIIGLRFELELRVIAAISPYVFAKDADITFISALKERGIVGVDVESSYVREYKTSSAGHILGYTRLMDPDDYEYYKTLDYPMDAVIGYEGIEKAFEKYLHGVNGIVEVTTTEDGTVVSEKVVREAKSGGSVYTSLDLGLQMMAEDSLEYTVNSINKSRTDENKVTGGAVVVEQVKTGQILASVSYPFYDPGTFSEKFTELSEAENSPLYNRAAFGEYNPGSTFKMVTGFAGLKTGFIGRYTTHFDGGVYEVYDDYQPRCWIYSVSGGGHGDLDIATALQNSCNVFFFWVADNIGIDAIGSACRDFGLGLPTGIEIDEHIGTIPSREYKESIGQGTWWPADDLVSAIGQGYNLYTPLQLANYCATIANGGTRYKLTLLNSVRSADYSAVVYENEPTVLYEIPEKEYIGYLQEGMELVAVGDGSAQPAFEDCAVKVGAKTGTVQSDLTDYTSGVFLCYAPAEDPEIAISIVVEKGTSGTTIMDIGRKIVDYYFARESEASVPDEYTLLP